MQVKSKLNAAIFSRNYNNVHLQPVWPRLKSIFQKQNRPVMITALINNRAVSLIGLLNNRAVNLIDLEHSTLYVSLPGYGIQMNLVFVHSDGVNCSINMASSMSSSSVILFWG